MHSLTRAKAIALTLSCFSAAIAGCAPPLQNGGVDVRPGVAERLGLLCRWRYDLGAEPLCFVEEEEPAVVTAETPQRPDAEALPPAQGGR